MKNISFATLNINGGGASHLRQAQVKNLFERKKAQVLLLQETHITPNVEHDWCQAFKGQCYFSNLSASSAGVGFFLKPGLAFESCSFQEVIKGRLISLQLVHQNFRCTIFNVYAPSESRDRKAFFTSMINHLKSVDLDQCVCIGGDFNCTFDPSKDRNSAEPHPESHADLSRFFKTAGLLDVWRLHHPNVAQYTWCRWANGRVSSARLDRWYINVPFRNVVVSSGCFPSLFSDHHMVTLDLSFPRPTCRNSYWKFNVKLLEDRLFADSFRDFWAEMCTKKSSFSSISLWWDNLKAQIRVFCQQFNSHCTDVKHITMACLEVDILRLEGKLANGSNAAVYRLLLEKKAQLRDLIHDKAVGTLVRLRIQNFKVSDTPTKSFFHLETVEKPARLISSVLDPGGNILTNARDIRLNVINFFSELFKAKTVSHEMMNVLTSHLPSVTEAQRLELDAPITLPELTGALAEMESGKAPGIDGLPAEFFLAFWDILGPELLKVLDASFLSGELPLSFRRAVLCLLPKTGDLRHLSNWRPISLLCTDYKLFSKVLANRLKMVIGDLVSPDQSCGIPGRSIYDNIFLIRDLVTGNCVKEDFGLVFLDLAKAFDSIDHEFLCHVLQACGLGANFRAYIALLYAGISSLIKVNNEFCPPIKVQRGVRQGCPLSGLLFALALEPLLIALRKDIPGLVLSPGHPPLTLSAYADDLCVIIKGKGDSDALAKCLSDFNLASSLRCNWGKSKALWFPLPNNGLPGPPLLPPPPLPAELVWANDGVKYLGVFLGPPQYAQNNWDRIIDQVEGRLSRWKRALPHLSYKGRVLIVNNLVTTLLWHRFICLQPPEVLLQAIQRKLVDFFWGGYHWLRPSAICCPSAEGGHGLVNVKCRLLAFRLRSIQRLLYAEHLPGKPLACSILQRAGRLGYGQELFLINLQHVDASLLPVFYRSLLNAWQGVSISRHTDSYGTNMFAHEPLFFNPLFPDIPRSRDFCQHFIVANILKVCHLRHYSGHGWRPANELADLTGVRSRRLVGNVLRAVIRRGHQLGLQWTQDAGVEPTVPKLIVAFTPNDLPPMSTGSPPFHAMSSKSMYRSCVKLLLGDPPLAGVTRWKGLLPPGPPSEPLWDTMYAGLISKRTGDLQGRLAHWIVPSNAVIRFFSPHFRLLPLLSGEGRLVSCLH